MTESIEWAEKYRPRTLENIVGNKKAVQDIRMWAEAWRSGELPDKRAVILHGPAGVGKTSSAHALARDLDWEVIELNASDQRTAKVIEKIAGSAASMNSLYGNRRLIILDEADNIHGNSDRGGMRALSGIIKNTGQPMVLIANDVYGLTPTIRNLCLEIKFTAVQSRSITPALRQICEAEDLYCSPEAVQKIAENAGGDIRSAVNDLQAAASGKTALEAEDVRTAERDVKDNIFKAMQKIFKSTDPKIALEAAYGLDENPEDLVQWIDENLPQQYAGEDLTDIRTGYGYLAKADLFLGRVRKRQNYGMWKYANMLMVCGTVAAKSGPYHGFIKFQQPSIWRKMGQTRSQRNMRDNVATKIGEHCFESMHDARTGLMRTYSRMARDDIYAVDITAGLGLELEELMYLTGSKKLNKKVQNIYDSAQELLSEKGEKEESKFFKSPKKDLKNQKTPESQKTLESLLEKTPAMGQSKALPVLNPPVLNPPALSPQVHSPGFESIPADQACELKKNEGLENKSSGAGQNNMGNKNDRYEDSVGVSDKKKKNGEPYKKSQKTLFDF